MTIKDARAFLTAKDHQLMSEVVDENVLNKIIQEIHRMHVMTSVRNEVFTTEEIINLIHKFKKNNQKFNRSRVEAYGITDRPQPYHPSLVFFVGKTGRVMLCREDNVWVFKYNVNDPYDASEKLSLA